MPGRFNLSFVLVVACLATAGHAAGQAATLQPAAAVATADTEVTPSSQPIKGKLKPEDDVNLIGHRDVGGGIDFYSQAHETEIGRSLADQVMKSAKVINDPAVDEYINRLAQNLVRNSDAKVPFTVHVLQDDSMNAFALPGGFFFVNSGLILALNEEDELAGVMAHEISHVCARHATRNMTKGELEQIAAIPVMIAAGPGLAGLGTRIGADVIIPQQYMMFSRAAEAEADWLGTQYLWKAGYDPNGLVRAFEILESEEKQKPGLMGRTFATHPQTPDRVAKSKEEIATIIPARPEYIVTTSDFDAVKARLRALLNSSIEKGVRVPNGPATAAPPSSLPSGPPVIQKPPVIDHSGDGGGGGGSPLA